MSDPGRSLLYHYEFSSLSWCGPSVKPAPGFSKVIGYFVTRALDFSLDRLFSI